MSVKMTDEEYKKAVTFRHAMHRYPELSNHEFQTTERIRAFLKEIPGITVLDLPVKTGAAAVLQGCGQVPTGASFPKDRENRIAMGSAAQQAVFSAKGGARKAGIIALRADIDALPQTELAESDFISEVPGVMHACGHDIHTASLLGAAMMLSRARNRFSGTVLFIFQKAEETTSGAKEMLDAGLFTSFQPDLLIGLHNWPSVPVGSVVVKAGALMAAKTNFEVLIHGSGGHGGSPQLGADPIVCSAAIISSLQSVVSRNSDPMEGVVCSVNYIEGGSEMNLVVNDVRMRMTVRALSQSAHDNAMKHAEMLIRGIAKAYGCTAEIRIHEVIPPVVNAADTALFAKNVAESVVGADQVVTAPSSLASEDFAVLAREVPKSFFFWVGSHTPGTPVYDLHNARFRADDRTIRTASELYAECVLTFFQFN